jgi:hypothetical protein
MDKKEYKRQNEERDKKNNKKSFGENWFGWWKTPSDRFAALIALFTAVLAAVAYFQLSAMRSTDDAIRGQLEEMRNQQRPILIAQSQSITSPFTIDGIGNAKIGVSFTITNIGHTTATHVSPFALIATSPQDVTKLEHQTCEAARGFSEHEISSIGVNQTIQGSIEPTIQKREVESISKNGAFVPVIIACIDYQDPVGRVVEPEIFSILVSRRNAPGIELGSNPTPLSDLWTVVTPIRPTWLNHDHP